MSPKVTVFTPTYNRAHTLPRAMESLRDQSFKDFEWLIINDGSTDNTDELVANFIKNSGLNIRYIKQDNQHKFLTFFKAIDLAHGKYFCPLDSDDALPPKSLEILYNTWEKISPEQNIVFVSSLCQDQFGNIIGDYFPKTPLICSIFDMRYIHKIKGDKWGMGKTEIYKKMHIDKGYLKGQGFIPEGVFQFQFDKLGYHYCINEVTRIYYRDTGDSESLANQYYDSKNAFGLAENYRAFINHYASKFWIAPKTIVRNLGGYLKYSKLDGRSFTKTLAGIDDWWIKILVTLAYPFSRLIK